MWMQYFLTDDTYSVITEDSVTITEQQSKNFDNIENIGGRWGNEFCSIL